ncbi:alpha/beta hydrolase [Amycolatopsis pigmentata]|uniref:Alpha/beta hydrolase n=1 Tax=Amycolatopsis pigmentata TaxID=450801 RepID=A0ABW5FPI2_9PSEU
MALDSQTRAFLAGTSLSPAVPPECVTVELVRAAGEQYAGLALPREEMHSVIDVTVPDTGGAGTEVRIYRPNAAKPLPVVVWLHGGAWVRLSVETLDNHVRAYASRTGCAIAAVSFTRAPESRFPAQIEEIHAVATWLKHHATEHGLDANAIAIAGESSGANLAAAVTLLDRERQSVHFVLQVLLAPLLDARFASVTWDEFGQGYAMGRGQFEWALAHYAPGVDRTEPLLSPVHAESLAGLPPAHVVVGEYDPLRADGETYAARLRRDGVPAVLDVRAGMIHQAHIAPAPLDTGRAMVIDTAAAIREALLPTTASSEGPATPEATRCWRSR